MGLEALAVGEEGEQAFTAAVAHETVAASLRRLMRLDQAREHADAAIGTLRELGARWELASALSDRGVIHRLAGRMDEAETDLREAFLLCRDLDERALVTWTAAELARILAHRGDPSSARQILGIWRRASPSRSRARPPPCAWPRPWRSPRATAKRPCDAPSQRSSSNGPRGVPNPLAAQVWWTARLFGAHEVGGASRPSGRGGCCWSEGWEQALAEPDMVAELQR